MEFDIVIYHISNIKWGTERWGLILDQMRLDNINKIW